MLLGYQYVCQSYIKYHASEFKACVLKLPPHKPQNFLHLSLVKEELQSGQVDSHHDSSFTQLELSHNPQYFLQSRLATDVLQSGRAASQYSLSLHSKGPTDRNN